MTDTPDWADVIADDIWDDHVMEYEPKFGRSLIADALRKAKAAGLREAAEIVMMGGASEYNDKVRSFARAAAATVSAQADKLESGS